MRNLKKILALVLALMMVLSVMVTASAVSFEDAESINYTEAVEVMAAAGILNGYKAADGTYTFNPTGTLNRAEAAKIIAYVLTGGDLESIEDGALDQPFTDVADSWAEKYIAYIAYAGIVDGNGAGGYNPTNTLTGYQFAKMLLNVLGIEGEYTGDNWKLNVGNAASDAELTKGMAKGFLFKNDITREEAAQMAFNAMKFGGETKIVGYKANNNANLVFPTYLEAYVVAGNNPANVTPVTESTGCILSDTFGIVAGTLATDDLGRPETIVWKDAKNNVIYTEYAIALATVYGATYDPTAKEWENYNFAGAAYLYNGVAGVANWHAADLTKPGVTSEFYGSYNRTTQKYDVTKVVSTEYYYAQVTDVNATTKNITLTVSEAGYVLGNSGAGKAITVAYDATKTADKQSDNYKALASYEKGTVLAVLVAPNWENDLTILDVQVPTEVKGTVTGAAIAPYYEGYVVVNGEKLTFANEYNQTAVDVGSDGTFYMLNGLVIGFVGTRPADAATETVYVVDHFATYVPAVDPVVDAYGTVVKAGTPAYYLISAQGVTLDGEVINIPVATAAEDTSGNSTYTANEQQIKKYTATATGLYTVGAADEVVAITVDKTKVSYSNNNVNYYYDAAEYVSILGTKSDIVVSAGSVAAAHNNGTAWAVYNKTTDANKTVAKIFYFNATVGTPVPENFFLYTGVNTVPEKSQITLADGTTKVNVYTYNVYEAGEAKTIKSYEANLVADYYDYYVDQYGIAVLTELDGLQAVVSNVYGNYITINGVVENYDITGIKVLDLTKALTAADKTSGNGIIDKGETIVVYAIPAGNTYVIDCIYITAGVQAQ